MIALSDEDRIASVAPKLRREIVQRHQQGITQKQMHQDYGVPLRTISVICRVGAQEPKPKPEIPPDVDLWNRPDIWPRLGLKGPTELRMVPIASSHRRS